MLVFPTSMGRFYQYEDFGMIGALSERINDGRLQVFCVDSVDEQSWYNKTAHPRDRVLRHIQYENYIAHEFIPFIRHRTGLDYLVVTGCSFGAYHTANFSFKHPELVNKMIALSGGYDVHRFLDGYYDDNCYFNCPVDYLSNLSDDYYRNLFRNRMEIVLVSSDLDVCLDDTVRLSHILKNKAVPHTLDVWGGQTPHDWPAWQKMILKYV